jgi:uncharacterized membrane protein
MNSAIGLGRYVFAATMAAFGLQHIVCAIAGPGLAPAAPWVAGGAVSSSIFGGLLIASAIGIAAGRRVVLPAAALGAILFIYDAVVYLPALVANVRDPLNWTRGTEILAMCGVAFVIAGTRETPPASRWTRIANRVADAGLLLVAVSVFVWGAQHFIYARFTATLVPSWIPWRLFWAVFVGGAFLAASLAFAFRVQPRLAGVLLGVEFLIIVLLVHVPRVAAHPLSGREWTNALVAATMFGAAWTIAGAFRDRG